ncbi:hypothetical protein GJ496_000094 [Pomphorhynchus laevis]|nr:hypothetical protein GJ496_000094 [Pomphorhynchus laevis]
MSKLDPPQTETTADPISLEEDDEFEEFPAEEWAEDTMDKDDLNLWEDNWDDEDIDDDFSVKLIEELKKLKQN